jgi:hypothetical protein
MSSQSRDAQLRPTMSPEPVILQDFEAEHSRGRKKRAVRGFMIGSVGTECGVFTFQVMNEVVRWFPRKPTTPALMMSLSILP